MKTYISFIILSCIALTLSVTTGRKLMLKAVPKENSAEKQDSMMVMMILVIVKTLEFVLKQ